MARTRLPDDLLPAGAGAPAASASVSEWADLGFGGGSDVHSAAVGQAQATIATQSTTGGVLAAGSALPTAAPAVIALGGPSDSGGSGTVKLERAPRNTVVDLGSPGAGASGVVELSKGSSRAANDRIIAVPRLPEKETVILERGAKASSGIETTRPAARLAAGQDAITSRLPSAGEVRAQKRWGQFATYEKESKATAAAAVPKSEATKSAWTAYPQTFPSCDDAEAWSALLAAEATGKYGPPGALGYQARWEMCINCPRTSAARKALGPSWCQGYNVDYPAPSLESGEDAGGTWIYKPGMDEPEKCSGTTVSAGEPRMCYDVTYEMGPDGTYQQKVGKSYPCGTSAREPPVPCFEDASCCKVLHECDKNDTLAPVVACYVNQELAKLSAAARAVILSWRVTEWYLEVAAVRRIQTGPGVLRVLPTLYATIHVNIEYTFSTSWLSYLIPPAVIPGLSKAYVLSQNEMNSKVWANHPERKQIFLPMFGGGSFPRMWICIEDRTQAGSVFTKKSASGVTELESELKLSSPFGVMGPNPTLLPSFRVFFFAERASYPGKSLCTGNQLPRYYFAIWTQSSFKEERGDTVPWHQQQWLKYLGYPWYSTLKLA